MLLVDEAAAIKGQKQRSVFLTVMNPESESSEEALFCPQIYKQIQKENK